MNGRLCSSLSSKESQPLLSTASSLLIWSTHNISPTSNHLISSHPISSLIRSSPHLSSHQIYSHHRPFRCASLFMVAESGFDPPTSGLWAQHASKSSQKLPRKSVCITSQKSTSKKSSPEPNLSIESSLTSWKFRKKKSALNRRSLLKENVSWKHQKKKRSLSARPEFMHIRKESSLRKLRA